MLSPHAYTHPALKVNGSSREEKKKKSIFNDAISFSREREKYNVLIISIFLYDIFRVWGRNGAPRRLKRNWSNLMQSLKEREIKIWNLHAENTLCAISKDLSIVFERFVQVNNGPKVYWPLKLERKHTEMWRMRVRADLYARKRVPQMIIFCFFFFFLYFTVPLLWLNRVQQNCEWYPIQIGMMHSGEY